MYFKTTNHIKLLSLKILIFGQIMGKNYEIWRSHPYMGIAFQLITQLFFSNFKKKDILVTRTSVATSRAPICLVLTLNGEFDIFGPKLGMATLRAIFSPGSLEPLQKFGHGSLFFGQLLSQNRVSHQI